MGEAKVRHRQRLFGGKETANEVHRRVVWGDKRCTGCKGKPVVVEVKVIMLITDLPSQVQAALRLGLAIGDEEMPRPFETPKGPALKVGGAYACRDCKRTLLREAAKGPSYAQVYIDEGVGEDKPFVDVTK